MCLAENTYATHEARSPSSRLFHFTFALFNLHGNSYRAHQIIMNKTMNKLLLLLLLSLGSAEASWQPPVKVSTGADSGPGSLRAALENGATDIKINRDVDTIRIKSTLVYSGSDAVSIQGFSAKIEADGDFTLLELSSGADLSISDLTLRGIGGFDLETPGTGKGIFIAVPLNKIGVVHVDLQDVKVEDVAYHGIHVSDCSLADDCGSGSGGGGDGSSASIHASLKRVTVKNAGFGKFDGDGIRIDERGDGDIAFDIKDSTIVGAGADGIELDEGDDGDVIATVMETTFKENGGYCIGYDLALGGPCVDDGDLDLDDGLDIDEAGNGDVTVFIKGSDAIDNFDEGFDLDEEGPGDLVARFIKVTAKGNGDEGIKCSEEDDGDVNIEVLGGSTVNNNGDDGMQFESEDAGRIDVFVSNTEAKDNKKFALKVEQDNAEALGSLKITSSASIEDFDYSNVELL